MENDALEKFISSNEMVWKKSKKNFLFLKLRKTLTYLSIFLIVLALIVYFGVEEHSFELALIPAVLAIGLFYFVFFQIKKPDQIYADIASGIIPLILYSKEWNIEYQYRAKPHFREFKASRLYPYSLSSLDGNHFFSGIAKKMPFIAWFVDANYREKVGESPLSMVSSSSEFNGFLGFQIMVKNLVPPLNGTIIIEKDKNDDLTALKRYYENDDDWKVLKTDDSDIKRNFSFYTSVRNPINSVNELIIKKMNKLRAKSSKPISVSIRKNHVFLNQYWSADFMDFDFKKPFKENIRVLVKKLDELIELSFILSLPA